MLTEALPLTTADLPAPDWGRLGEHLPAEWIEAALSYAGKASIRRRRLPAQQVVWLVIALALYRHHSVRQVLAELDLALPDLRASCVTDSAASQARGRLGAQPLAWLFATSASHWHQHDGARYQFEGLQLLAVDGTTLKLSDSRANRDHFGGPAFANGAQSSHPHARLVTLCALDTQLVVGARFGRYNQSETGFAMELLEQIADHSLTVFDRGFLSAELLGKLTRQGQQRHFLVPAKSNTRWTVIEGNEQDALVEMQVSAAARKKDPALPSHWRARAVLWTGPQGQRTYLLTSLLDRQRYPLAKLRQCYLRRWQIETSYRELKQTMMGMALSLRSQSVEATTQEIWGLLIAYNLIRVEMARTAEQARCAPSEISFVFALAAFQYEMMHAAALQAIGNMPGVLKRMRERMLLELNVYRPGRKFDRVAKAKPQRYPERRLHKTLT